MKILSVSPQIKPPQRLWWVGLLVLGLLLGSCSTAARSDNGSAIDSELEEQVLQIIRDNPEAILESVETYRASKQNKTRQARQAFLQQLLENPASTIGDSPTKGATEQNIVLIEFSDFQCPYCAQAHATIDEFMAKYGDIVTLTYKHLPLTSIHPEALPAAKAAQAAAEQGKFWEYHSALFERQEELGEALYVAIAEELSLDREKFDRDRQSSAAETAIGEDLKLAEELGLTGTPVFFLNEETLTGAIELTELEAALERVTRAN
ncbi:DsbA family protein [Oscillatoriales cyanobacterium LEGE 11467]|uniref:DsbA family protein n=1 Tax=Zarconia navalis LEGE 11467 TaxID=1828826 RepID=A0A928VY52_9CYAN|nr:DsbA family protein [Zarconia navalis]MBE9040288.1 DsbA family protein [Zarconia navalis LEGE 11467]